MADLVFTGERFLPDCRGEIWLEHWHRYHFAASLARNRRVLDVACGEGYGSALLSIGAREVVGVDAAVEAIAHARATYGHLDHLRFLQGDCAALPFADASFDIVVSFETIEHISAQREFLGEVRRVLAPQGVLLLSSPNKAEYSDRRGYSNPYHVAELYRDELRELLGGFFPHAVWYRQGLGFCSTIAAEQPPSASSGELLGDLPDPAAASGSPDAREPLYYIVGCATDAAALAAVDSAFSVLRDPDDTVYRDYQDTYRKFVAASEAVAIFREREAKTEVDLRAIRESARTDLAFVQERLQAAEAQRDAARSVGDELRAEAERMRVEIEALKALAARLGATAHDAQQSASRMSAAMAEANRRYDAALGEAQRGGEELLATLATERARTRDELASRDAAAARLQRLSDDQRERLARRGWRRLFFRAPRPR